MATYKNLFEVRLYQKFFGEFTARDVEIGPTPATSGILSAYHLLFKPVPDGFVILYDTEKQFLLESQREELRLVFFLKAVSRHFETYTRLIPLNPATKYFFNNRHGSVSQADSPVQGRLHAGEEAGDADQGRFALSGTDPREWMSGPNVALEQQGAVLFDAVNPLKFPFVLSRDLESGWFTCRNSESGETVNGCRIEDSDRLAFGMIELYAGGGGDFAFQRVAGARYELRLPNRPVFWHYYLVSESGPPPEQVEIFAGKEKLSFSAPEMVRLINGQLATRVMSQQPMPLKFRYSDVLYRAEYTIASSDGIQSRLRRQINLPTPDSSRIKGRKGDAGDEYFWEVFVYL